MLVFARRVALGLKISSMTSVASARVRCHIRDPFGQYSMVRQKFSQGADVFPVSTGMARRGPDLHQAPPDPRRCHPTGAPVCWTAASCGLPSEVTPMGRVVLQRDADIEADLAGDSRGMRRNGRPGLNTLSAVASVKAATS